MRSRKHLPHYNVCIYNILKLRKTASRKSIFTWNNFVFLKWKKIHRRLMIKITQPNEQMFYWHVHCCKQHLAWKNLPKLFDCYKFDGISKNYVELFSTDLYVAKQKLAVPQLCNEIMLTVSQPLHHNLNYQQVYTVRLEVAQICLNYIQL